MTASAVYKGGEWSPQQELDLDRPVFVLTAARSGSTLLRFLLDTHPALGCPPETGFGAACESLARLGSVLDGISPRGVSTVITRTAETNDTIKSVINHFAAAYLRRTAKSRWCDKSLDNIEFSYLLSQIWPRAQFICLTRHCMDVAYSAIESARWGLSGFGIREHVIRNPGNNVAAAVEYWVRNVERVQDFQDSFPDRCHWIKYEDLVAQPEVTVSELFRFLGVAQVPGITESCFTVGHEAGGPGDEKIWLTSEVHSRSVGRGRAVPIFAIPDRLRSRANELLRELDYDELDDDWNNSGSLLLRPDHGDTARSAQLLQVDAGGWAPPVVTAEQITEVLRRWPHLTGATVGVGVRAPTGNIEAAWLLQSGHGDTVAGAHEDPDISIVGELSAWRQVWSGEENLAVACLNSKLQIKRRRPQRNWTVLPDEAHALAFLLGLRTARQAHAPLAAAAAESRKARRL